jgi:hypothetical protein
MASASTARPYCNNYLFIFGFMASASTARPDCINYLLIFGFMGASVSMTGRVLISTRSSLSNVWRQMASISSLRPHHTHTRLCTHGEGYKQRQRKPKLQGWWMGLFTLNIHNARRPINSHPHPYPHSHTQTHTRTHTRTHMHTHTHIQTHTTHTHTYTHNTHAHMRDT